ncbi:Argininosuccinate lyase [Trichinella spiralis]|uniref:Argininosuccinate lyase n=1 Tax=Trichinella spiralis TaxID=6334 RepID=A0ABR3KP15_TRISP
MKPVLHCSSRMKFRQNSVDEKLYGSLYGVGAPAKYLVLTNQEMTSSETVECDAERPMLTDAQLEAGMMSQKVEISEQLEEAGTRDCANSEEDEDLAEAFETYFYYFMIFFDLSVFMFCLWLTSLLFCKS